MPCPSKKAKHRKHTPIVSKAQRRMFGAELGRRKVGKKRRMKSITTEELRSHLTDSKGRRLPERTQRKNLAKKVKRRLARAIRD